MSKLRVVTLARPEPRFVFHPPVSLAAVFVCAAFLVGASICPGQLSAQEPGGVDASFNPGNVPYGRVNAIAVQPDGRILVGGNSVQRLNPDGSSSETLVQGLGNQQGVTTLVRQSDGKILAGGLIQNYYAGTTRDCIFTRLNADGTPDTSFNPSSVNRYYGVSVLAVQKDGKILISEAYDSYGDGLLIRLNPDGSQDTTFQAGYDVSGVFKSALVLNNGKILVGGSFSIGESNTDIGLARLNADGRFDSTFKLAYDADSVVETIVAQEDGKILVGGLFNQYQGIAHTNLVRISADGTLDASFNPVISIQDTFRSDSRVLSVAVQRSGQILIIGYFNTVGGAARNYVARLNADGSLDSGFTTTFPPDQSGGGNVYSLSVQTDGKILLGGAFSMVNGTNRQDIVRLNGEAVVHPAFFAGESSLSDGVYYLGFPGGNFFGYYSYLTDPSYIFHFDLGYEYVFDANDGQGGVYLYDFKSNGFFYTSPSFPFPYLYDFALNSTVYYYPDPANPGRYNTNGTRYFYVFNSGQIISK